MAAATLSVTIAMAHTTDGLIQSEPSATKARTPVAKNGRRNVQVIGFAADEVIDVTDVTTPKECYFKNLDATNYVDIGPNNSGAMLGLIRLQPGEHCVFPLLPGTVMRAQANTAAVELYCNIRPT
jgi:hypothetical protein